MALFAQIKFSQGIVLGVAGEALAGVVSEAVTVDHDPGVTPSDAPGSWEITLLYAPPGSTYEGSVPLVLGSANDATPTATFTPDVTGSYRLQLQMWTDALQIGQYSIDLRNFVVPEDKHGFVVPPYQQDPVPLPLLSSGLSTARANELNIDGQEDGWTGKGADGLLTQFIKQVDASNFDIVPNVTATGKVLTSAAQFADYNAPVDAVVHGDSVWFVNSGLANTASSSKLGVTRVRKQSGTISERIVLPSTAPFRLLSCAVSSGTKLWVIGTETDSSTYVTVSLWEVLVSSPGNTTFGPPVVLRTAAVSTPIFATGVVFDPVNNKLWVSVLDTGASGYLIGVDVDTMVVDSPVTITPPASSCGPLVIDLDTTHYSSGGPRLFIAEASGQALHRVSNLSGVPGIEASYTVAAADNLYGLAIGGGAAGLGGGRVYVLTQGGSGVFSYTTAGVALSSSAGTKGYGIVYVETNDTVLIGAQDVDQVAIGAFNADTFAAVGSAVQLPPHEDAAGPGGFSTYRYALSGPFAWVYTGATDKLFGANEPAGNAYRIDAVGLTNLLELETIGSATWQYSPSVLWRLDGTGDVATWDEVMEVVRHYTVPVTILMDLPDTYSIGPGNPGPAVTYDMKQARFVAKEAANDQVVVQLERFAVLHNLSGVSGGMRLQHVHETADAVGPALTFPATITPVFRVEKGAAILGTVAAEEPMILVTTANPEFRLVFDGLGTAMFIVATPAVGTVSVDAGAILNIEVTAGGLSSDTVQDTGWLASDATATVNWIHDGSMKFHYTLFTSYHANNAGTQVNKALGTIGGVGPNTTRPFYGGGGPPSIGCLYLNIDYGSLSSGDGLWMYYSGSYLGWLFVDGPQMYQTGVLGASQNNWDPYSPSPYMSIADIIYTSASVAVNITGLISSVVPAVLSRRNKRKLINYGTFNITLKNEDGASTAANRFHVAGGGDHVLVPDASVDIFYDSVISRWRVG